MSRLSRVTQQYVPRTRAAAALVTTAFVDSTGTGLYLAASTLYLTTVVGLPVAQVGLGLTVAGIAGLIATVPVGHLGDRIGARRVLVGVQLVRALAFVAFAFVQDATQFVALCVVMGASEGPVSALMQSVVASAVEEKDRVHTLALIRSARNVAFTLGALVAAPLLAVGTPWAFRATVLLDAASFVVGAVLLARVALATAVPVKVKASLAVLARSFRDGPFLALTALNGLFMVHITVLLVAVPVWAVDAGKLDAAAVPLLVVVNTVLAVVLQAPLSAVAERPGGGLRAMGLGVVALAASCGTFALVGVGPGWLVPVTMAAGVVLLTLAEVWQSAGEWELSYAFAPEDRRTLYLSVFSLSKTVQSTVGPALLAVVLLPLGRIGWVVLAVLLLAAWPVFVRVVRVLEKRSVPAVERTG